MADMPDEAWIFIVQYPHGHAVFQDPTAYAGDRPKYRLDTPARANAEKMPREFEINMLRCIYCGFCEDACPTEAIVLGDNYELSFTSRQDAIYTKDRLLEPVDAESMLTPRKVDAGVFTRSVPEMKDPTD